MAAAEAAAERKALLQNLVGAKRKAAKVLKEIKAEHRAASVGMWREPLTAMDKALAPAPAPVHSPDTGKGEQRKAVQLQEGASMSPPPPFPATVADSVEAAALAQQEAHDEEEAALQQQEEIEAEQRAQEEQMEVERERFEQAVHDAQ